MRPLFCERPCIRSQLACLDSGLAQAAGYPQSFTRNPTRVSGGEEDCRGRDVLHLADTSERGLRFELLTEFAGVESGGVHAFGQNHSGIDGIHADLAWAEFFREASGDGVDRA